MSATRMTATISGGALPPGANVGDVFEFSGIARVVGIEEDMIDVTMLGHVPGSNQVPGERKVALFINEVRIGVAEPVA